MERQRILVTGRVQGVGFRPAVYRLANQLGLSGFVLNDTRGVTIELQGPEEKIAEFVDRLSNHDKPPLAERTDNPHPRSNASFKMCWHRIGEEAVNGEVEGDAAEQKDLLTKNKCARQDSNLRPAV